MTGALCFPWYVGAGHTGRLLEVSRLLEQVGASATFAYDPTGSMVGSSGRETLGLPFRSGKVASPGTHYLGMTGLDDVYARHGYYHESLILEDVERDRALIRKVRPSFVIVHMQPTAVLAARTEGVPVISIADADFFVEGESPWMPWLEGTPCAVSPFPTSVPAFAAAAESLGLTPPSSASDLLLGEFTLIASIEAIEQPAKTYADVPGLEFIGPMVWDPGVRGPAPPLAKARRVFATTGGGDVAASNFDRTVVSAAAAGGKRLSVLVTGAVPLPETHALPFGALTQGIMWSDVVLCHGGHSTILAALQQGRPIVVLGAMSENEANGRLMVEANGVGHNFWRSECHGGRIRQLAPSGRPVGDAEHHDAIAQELAELLVRTANDDDMVARCAALQESLAKAKGHQAAFFEQIVRNGAT